MFQFQESQILTPSINGRQELVFKIKVKKEDYTLDDFERMALMFENTSFVVVLAPFQEKPPEDPLPKLRQQLALVIQEYCEVANEQEWREVGNLYQRNNVNSRTELSEEQLRKEIDKYIAWIQQFKN